MRRRQTQMQGCTALAGYWQTWDAPGGETIPIGRVPCQYTDIIIAFVVPDEAGGLRIAGPNAPTCREICRLRDRGHNVLLSIGGGGVAVTLSTEEEISRFRDSLYEWIRALRVNGVDIDVEQGMPAGESPLAPEGTQLGLIRALDPLLNTLPRDFLLTMAPETANLVGGISRYGGNWGNYLPLVMHYAARLTRVHMQYYNSGPMLGLDGQAHEPGTVSFAVAMTDAIIAGFDIAQTGVRFAGLPPWKVAVGLPASPLAAVNGYLAPQQVREALALLQSGQRAFGAAYPCVRPYPHFGGLMTWSVQWDADIAYLFSETGARALELC